MWLNRRFRTPAAGALAVATLACLVAIVCAAAPPGDTGRPSDARLDALKATFRQQALASEADAERDPVWRLGRSLFEDPRLSASGHSSCATCHQSGHGWSEASPRAVGDGGTLLAFKAPTLVEAGRLDRYGWTGRFQDLAAVTTFALTSAANMGASLPDIALRLGQDDATRTAFASAFGNDRVDSRRIVHALGAYVASLGSQAPFDRWIAGDEAAIDATAKRGFTLFVGKAGCAQCHEGPSLTDGSFHDVGASMDDPGRGQLFPSSVKLRHAFKTPSLRDVAARAPFMHDGSRATLMDVVELYDGGGIERESRADGLHPLHLSADEKSALVAFLGTLTGETRYRRRAEDVSRPHSSDVSLRTRSP